MIHQLFSGLNRLVARIVPFGILVLPALNIARLDWPQLLCIQEFFQLSMLGFLLLTILCAGTLLALVLQPAGQLWRAIRGPLALTASSASLPIALPMLVENLRHELSARLDADGRQSQPVDELAPLVSLGYALTTLGQVAALWFIPFAGWYVHQQLSVAKSCKLQS